MQGEQDVGGRDGVVAAPAGGAAVAVLPVGRYRTVVRAYLGVEQLAGQVVQFGRCEQPVPGQSGGRDGGAARVGGGRAVGREDAVAPRLRLAVPGDLRRQRGDQFALLGPPGVRPQQREPPHRGEALVVRVEPEILPVGDEQVAAPVGAAERSAQLRVGAGPGGRQPSGPQCPVEEAQSAPDGVVPRRFVGGHRVPSPHRCRPADRPTGPRPVHPPSCPVVAPACPVSYTHL